MPVLTLDQKLNELNLIPSQEERKKNSLKKVIVGLSGGVDSSVSALILKKQGYQVIGVFMKNWEGDSEFCTAEEDYKDVEKVAQQLEIPYYTLNFAQEYEERVFNDFLSQYKQGLTPNPDIFCNSEIKFDSFFDNAMKMGADYLATGHYCQISHTEKESSLIKGIDPNKDQTYFLHRIEANVLKKTLFPIGGILKPEVRRIAELAQIPTAKKKDSTGICFIGEKDFRGFLSRYIESTKGHFVELETQEIVGKHQGHCFYTIGQRKGLGLGGAGKAWFVVGKDPSNNNVYVVRGEEHPSLYGDDLIVKDLHWLIPPGSLPKTCKAKIRYRQQDQECAIEYLQGDRAKVSFKQPQRAIAPGQSIVFYSGEHCLGGGIIEQSGPSHYDKLKKVEG